METINDISHREALEFQIGFESSIWLTHVARDNRANHNDAEALRLRKEAMGRIDGLLDKLNIVLEEDNGLRTE